MEKLRINWIDHIISFLSALIGIFIAFQLNDWQESRKEKQNLRLTLDAIKTEILENRKVYKQNMENLSLFVEYWDFSMKNRNKEGNLVTSEKKLNQMIEKNKVFKGRFDKVSYIKKINDSINAYKLVMNIDVLPNYEISTSNWETAKASGIINTFDHKQLTKLTQIYFWIERDMGIDETDPQLLRATESDFDSIDGLIIHYTTVVRVSEWKLKKIDQYFDTIDWEVR